MMIKLKEHRDEYLSIFNQSEEERSRTEKIRLDKQEQDNYNKQQILTQFEKKVQAEVDTRISNEDELRKYLETKFVHFHE